jgi:uncharacterized membrane protein
VIALLATFYDWLLLVHILAAMVWLGGLAILSVIVTRVVRARDLEQARHLLGNLRVLGPLLFAPAPAVLLGAGIWLVLKGWDFGDGWVVLGLTLFAVAFLFGAILQSRAAIAAGRALAAGEQTEAARHLRRWSWGSRLILLLLIVATWDMTLKPGF